MEKRFHKRLVFILACIVTFCVTYALILPAITMSRPTICGREEHEHIRECRDAEGVLICGTEEHQHTSACYENEGETSSAEDAFEDTGLQMEDSVEGVFSSGEEELFSSGEDFSGVENEISDLPPDSPKVMLAEAGEGQTGSVRITASFYGMEAGAYNTLFNNSPTLWGNSAFYIEISPNEPNYDSIEPRKLNLRSGKREGRTFTWEVTDLKVTDSYGRPVSYTITENNLLDNCTPYEIEAVKDGNKTGSSTIHIAPEDSKKKATLAELSFGSDETYSLTIINKYRDRFELQLQLVDGVTGEPLNDSGSFRWRPLSGESVDIRCSMGNNGIVYFDSFKEGTYILTARPDGPPSGYVGNAVSWLVTAAYEDNGDGTTIPRVRIKGQDDPSSMETVCYEYGRVTPYTVRYTPITAPTPMPTATPTPMPTATPTPTPTAAPTPTPTAAPTPTPTATPTPMPTATPTPMPTSTPIPLPTVTPEPPETGSLKITVNFSGWGDEGFDSFIANSKAGTGFYIQLRSGSSTDVGIYNINSAERQGNSFTWTIEDLPVTDGEGEPIKYTIQENKYRKSPDYATVINATISIPDMETRKLSVVRKADEDQAVLEVISLKKDKEASLDITNRYGSCFDFQLQVCDISTGNPLNGKSAEFGLYVGDRTEPEYRASMDDTGTVSFNNLSERTYLLKEIASPAGYLPNSSQWTVTAQDEKNGDETKTARVRIKTENGTETICYEEGTIVQLFKVFSTPETVTGMVQIEKVFSGLTDGEVQSLKDKSKADSDTGYYISLKQQTGEETSIQLFLSDTGVQQKQNEDGTTSFIWTVENLVLKNTEGQPVSYTVTEHNYLPGTDKTVTVGARISGKVIPVTTDSETRTATLVTSFEDTTTLFICNTYKALSLQVKAVAGNQSTEGASETESPLSGAGFELYTTSGEIETKIREATTDANGIAEFSNLAFGTYIMKEVTAPSGYAKKEAVWEVTIVEEAVPAGETTTRKKRIWVKEKTQDSSEDKGTLCYDDGQVYPYQVNHTSESLIGTVKIQKVFSGLTDTEINDFIQNSHSGGNGYYISLKRTEGGDTESRELFLSDQSVIRTTNADGATSFTWTVQNLQVKNIGGSLVGYTVTEHKYLPENPDNYANINVTASILGNGGVSVPVAVTTDKAHNKAELESVYFDQNGTDLLTITNRYVGFTLNVKAIDKKKRITEEGQETDRLLQGAVFGLYSLSDGFETEIAAAAADENGIAVFRNLIPGEYIMKEKTAPADYVRNTTVWTVSAGHEAVASEGESRITKARVWVGVKNDSPQVERTLCFEDGTVTPYVVKHTSVKGKVVIRTRLFGVKEDDEAGQEELNKLIENSKAASSGCYYIHIQKKDSKTTEPSALDRSAVTPDQDGSVDLYLRDAVRDGALFTWVVNDLPLVDSSNKPISYQISQYNYPLEGYAETVVDAQITQNGSSQPIGTDPNRAAGRAILDETTFSLDETADTLDISNRYTNEFKLRVLDENGETPLKNADVKVKNSEGNVLFQGVTDAGGFLTVIGVALTAVESKLTLEIAIGGSVVITVAVTVTMLYGWYKYGTATVQKEKDPDPQEKQTRLIVKKEWKTADGTVPHDEKVRIEVYYKTSKDHSVMKLTDFELPYYLTGSDPWIGSMMVPSYKAGTGLPYLYYIKEEEVSGYETIYSGVMEECITGDHLEPVKELSYCGSGAQDVITAVVTNKQKAICLPATGGEGTGKYTTGGILLITTASLLYGYTQRHKKQRKRRRL